MTDLTINKQLPILVTGGGGYIGTHVVELLLSKGYKVRIFDKFVFGKEILGDLKNNSNLEVHQGDISNLYKLTLAMKDTQALVHLAGIVGDPACALNPDFTSHMNNASTKIVKDLSKSFSLKRFIFASSCSVYGSSDEIVNEKSKLNPVSLYAKTKIDSEKELLEDKTEHFHPTILRFATVFGHSRRPRFDLVTNFFTAQAYVDGLITVKGSDQWRPFVHVYDIAQAIYKVLIANASTVNREIFNVGDDKINTTIGELAKTVASVVKISKDDKPVKIAVDDSLDDPRNYRVSFKKINNKLKFSSSKSLREGIAEMHQKFIDGEYLNNYKDKKYINVEMTKLMQAEFLDKSYRSNSISLLSNLPLSSSL